MNFWFIKVRGASWHPSKITAPPALPSLQGLVGTQVNLHVAGAWQEALVLWWPQEEANSLETSLGAGEGLQDGAEKCLGLEQAERPLSILPGTFPVLMTGIPNSCCTPFLPFKFGEEYLRIWGNLEVRSITKEISVKTEKSWLSLGCAKHHTQLGN